MMMLGQGRGKEPALKAVFGVEGERQVNVLFAS